MTKESGAGPEGTGSPDEEGGLIHDEHSTLSLKRTRRTESLGLTKRWRSSVEVEESQRCS